MLQWVDGEDYAAVSVTGIESIELSSGGKKYLDTELHLELIEI